MRGVALLGTQEAEDYLKDLENDASLSQKIRKMAGRCASRAYRKRVPLHIRRQARS